MWLRLILPDCRSCDVRKASSWKHKLCHMCLAEVELLEELLSLENPETPARPVMLCGTGPALLVGKVR